MGPVRQNPVQRTVSLFMCVCIALCTIVAPNIAENRPDSFPPYPPDNHHCSDDVYLREGGLPRTTFVICADLMRFLGDGGWGRARIAVMGPRTVEFPGGTERTFWRASAAASDQRDNGFACRSKQRSFSSVNASDARPVGEDSRRCPEVPRVLRCLQFEIYSWFPPSRNVGNVRNVHNLVNV